MWLSQVFSASHFFLIPFCPVVLEGSSVHVGCRASSSELPLNRVRVQQANKNEMPLFEILKLFKYILNLLVVFNKQHFDSSLHRVSS